MKILHLLLFCSCFVTLKAETKTTQNSTLQKSAVLITGFEASCAAVNRMNSIAILLKEKGYIVYKFYYPKAYWSSIKEKAKSCSFFVYTGHGVINGGLNGGFGGLSINEIITAKQIVESLKFDYKPLVIYLHACGAAGSSAGDPNDIGINEACKRICDTSLPFFMVGAGAYFAANTFGEGFLIDFLNGKALPTCFRIFSEPHYEILMSETLKTSNLLNQKSICISGAQNMRKQIILGSYDIAYVGPSNFTINSIQHPSK